MRKPSGMRVDAICPPGQKGPKFEGIVKGYPFPMSCVSKLVHRPGNAVVLLVFNRPEHTARVLKVVRNARPEKLFVVADGPRKGNESDPELCARTRELLESVDWPCVVERSYSDENLGLKKRVITGLDWVFQQVEQAIVLEDDCVPGEDFFDFCGELLHHYRADPRVWAVSGDNFQDSQPRGESSYYFSKYFHCWGWATWRRVWTQFRSEIGFWPELRSSPRWKQLHEDAEEQEYWSWIYDRVRSGDINSWAFPFMLNMWRAGGLCAIPQTNLVTNIGFGVSGTHCHAESRLSEIPTGLMRSISHPGTVGPDACADRYTFTTVYNPARSSGTGAGAPPAPADARGSLLRFARRLLRGFSTSHNQSQI